MNRAGFAAGVIGLAIGGPAVGALLSFVVLWVVAADRWLCAWYER